MMMCSVLAINITETRKNVKVHEIAVKDRMKVIAQLVHALSWTLAFSLVEQRPSTRRRSFVRSVIGGLSGIGIPLVPGSASDAWAAPPITQGEADNVGARGLRFLRPQPPRLLRPRINRDFAVLLMRCSYNALDELDCVAMDQFQRDFFIIRQAEYQSYVNYLGPGMVQQGDLTDPYYFDFISFAQYLTVNREITLDPPFVFEERQPIEVDDSNDTAPQQFVARLVRRDPSLTNELLAPEHSRKVGQAILNYIDVVLGDTGAGLPKFPSGTRPSLDQVLASFDQLVKVFVINGFAWDGRVAARAASPSSSEYILTLNSPPTLWGGQCLQQQRAKLTNHFLLKAASQLAGRLGYLVVASSVRYDGSNEITQIQLR